VARLQQQHLVPEARGLPVLSEDEAGRLQRVACDGLAEEESLVEAGQLRLALRCDADAR
jgi:hypothetical protein